MAGSIHASVLLREVIDALQPREGGIYIDATCGLGGHTEAILEGSAPDGKVLAVDRDPAAIEIATGRLSRFGERVTLVEGDFSELRVYAEASDHFPVDGLFADLGVSSMQLDDPGRGFSFMKEGPLDMRMGPRVGATAAELIESFDQRHLMSVLKDFGEINRPKEMAQAIIKARDEGKLQSTSELANIIEEVQHGRRGSPLHPATRAFQAIRIAVNRELEELATLLRELPTLIKPGGMAVIISFHSLEDRLVKHSFLGPEPEPQPHKFPVEPKQEPSPWEVLTKKPIVPTPAEVKSNPRCRSAKLRVARRTEVMPRTSPKEES